MKIGRPIIDRKDQSVNGVRVLRFDSINNREAVWVCLCHCGKKFKSRVRKQLKSCGCLKDGHPTHGHCQNGKLSPEYNSWRAMIARCTNPNGNRFKYYAGRGIKVCERWLKFENFFADMGQKPAGLSIDRFPNADGNYEPENCRWATALEQRHNRAHAKKLGFDAEVVDNLDDAIHLMEKE